MRKLLLAQTPTTTIQSLSSVLFASTGRVAGKFELSFTLAEHFETAFTYRTPPEKRNKDFQTSRGIEPTFFRT